MDNGRMKVLEKSSTFVNPITGEVQTEQQSVVLRTKRREKFMLVYVENFSMFVNLTKRTQEVLAMILAKKVTYGTNEVVLDPFFRTKLTEELNTSRQVIANSIAELVKQKVLQKQKLGGSYQYHLNPYLFGQGEWNAIQRQRQEFTLDYDFVNLTANKEIKTVTQYEGLPDAKDIQVLELERYEGENIKIEQALISDKSLSSDSDQIQAVLDAEQDSDQIQAVLDAEQDSDQIQAVEVLREQNKAKELEIRAKEIEIEKMRIEIEKMKMQQSLSQQSPSLFE